jgi:hypothetical protein
MVPSSGNSAKSVLAKTGPTPGTLLKSAPFSLKVALAPIASSRLPISVLDLLLEPADVGSDASGERLWGHLGAVTLGDKHRRELAPPGEDDLQGEGFLVGQDAGRGTQRKIIERVVQESMDAEMDTYISLVPASDA